MKELLFTTARGIPMRVVYLAPREFTAYPAAREDKPTVEFFDTRYTFTRWGQFTGGRYHTETLLDREYPGTSGLDLQGGEPDWVVDGRSMDKVLAFIAEQATVDA